MKKIINTIFSLLIGGAGLLKGTAGLVGIHSCKLEMAQKISTFPEEKFLGCANYRDYAFDVINIIIAIATFILVYFILKGKKQTLFSVIALGLLIVYFINYLSYSTLVSA